MITKASYLSWLAMLTIAFSVKAAILSPDGRPYTQIVLEDGQATSVQLAATELQAFLREISGDELPIVSEPTAKPFIIIGANKLLQEQGLSGDKLAPEGWAFKTTDDYLALYGQDYNGPMLFGPINPWRAIEAYNDDIKLNAFGASGTLSAVYEFLHRKAGVRFYMPGPDGTVVPRQETFRVPELDETGAPARNWRWLWSCFLIKNKDTALWSKRNGFGGKAPVMIIHSYREFQKYKDSHPEYFALVNGKRAFTNECVADGHGHLCLTNPAVIQQWADDICDYFDKNPEVEIYPLAPNDGLNKICECPDCQADLRPGVPDREKFSLHIWKFTAKVGEKVAERHPDRYVGCLAYSNYATPPAELGEMKNVAVMYCNFRRWGLNPAERERVHSEITEWSRRASRIYLWTWYLDHWLPNTGLPIIQTRNIQHELNWLFDNPKYGGEFLSAEAQNGINQFVALQVPGMQHLDLYTSGRMYLDPSTDADELFEEYTRLFYGPAAAPMKSFFGEAQDRLAALCQETRDVPFDKMFTPDFLFQLKGYLETAVKAAGEDNVYRRRIEVVKGEFDEAYNRVIRLAANGRQQYKISNINGFNDLDVENGNKFTGQEGEEVSPATWMYGGRDNQFLYLRFLCFEPDMTSLVSKIQAHDNDNIWMDDCIELFFLPDESDLKNAYHILINTNGVFFDGKVLGANERDTSWESQIDVNVRKEDNRWLLEVKLPFQSIGINDPNFTGHLITEFYRNRFREGKATFSCWSPTGMGYHFCPDKFGLFILN